MNNEAKKKDILELIRVSTLQPEQVDVMVPALVQQSLMSKKSDGNAQEIIAIAKQRALSDAFLEKLAAPFDETFSHEEIKKLIGFYKSEEMRKFFKTYTKTSAPVYPALNLLIEEVVSSATKTVPESDRVIAATKENYQKEVQECDQPVVLDVYSSFCGPCKTIAPIISELSNELSGKVKFIKLNVDQELAISQELGVCSLPTLLFLKNGKVIDRHVGVIHKNELDAKIKKAFR